MNDPKKKRPLLLLNTQKKCFDETEIVIAQGGESSYVIINHPLVTDITETGSVSHHKYGKMFFSVSNELEAENSCKSGEYFYVVQKSNGKQMQDTV
jgi:hypothetical protein